MKIADINDVASSANIYKLIPSDEKPSLLIPTREMVCKIAWIIAGHHQVDDWIEKAMYGEGFTKKVAARPLKKQAVFGPEEIDKILDELLDAAGYTASQGRSADSIIPRLSKLPVAKRHLRVGWFEWGDFTGDAFNGPSREITEWLKRLLKVAAIEPRKVEHLTDIELLLESREVDLIAPFILLPGRSLRIKMIPIPIASGLHTGINGLLAKNSLSRIGFDQKVESDVLTGEYIFEKFDPRKFHSGLHFSPNLVTGGVAELFTDLVGLRHPEYHPTIDRAVQRIREDIDLEMFPESRHSAPGILFADHFICRRAQRDSSEIVRLFKTPEWKMQLAFGVNRDEQQFAEDVQTSIDFMVKNRIIRGIISNFSGRPT